MAQFQFSSRTTRPTKPARRGWRWWQWTLAGIVAVVIIAAVGSYWWYQRAISSPAEPSGALVALTIEEGVSVQEIEDALVAKGLLKQQWAFAIYLRMSGLSSKLQSGNFQIPEHISIKDLVDRLQAASRNEATLQFIEGWRREEMAAYIDTQHDAGLIDMTGAEFSELALHPTQRLRDALGKTMSADDSLQGYLFPDTYVVDKEETAEDLITKMLAAYNKRVTPNILAGFAKQGLSEYEALTLAAIVERESHKGEERPIIAGILLKRLNEGIALYVDATIQYALGYSQAEGRWWRQNLTVDDLAVQSPYNTRLNAGLPPHPICNPGLTAIEAVANPAKTDYLYYLHDSEGVAHYAKTLEEHNANVARYLR